jgi:hypothetical protein
MKDAKDFDGVLSDSVNGKIWNADEDKLASAGPASLSTKLRELH